METISQTLCQILPNQDKLKPEEIRQQIEKIGTTKEELKEKQQENPNKQETNQK